jgi:hypothetical protein
LKNPDETFEPAVNIIPVPDAPGPKLDYYYEEVNNNNRSNRNSFIFLLK